MAAGFIDILSDRKAHGWATGDHDDAVIVELLANDALIGEVLADEYREDLFFAGYGAGRHGWTIEIPDEIWSRGSSFSARIKGTGFPLVNNAERASKRHFQNFLNSTFSGYPKVETAFTSRSVDEIDVVISREMIHIYREMPEYIIEPGSIWDVSSKSPRSSFKEILRQGSAGHLAEFLVSLPTKQEAEGFLQGESAYRAFLATDAVGLGACEGPTKDALVSLAQYLALERLETAEVGPLGEAILLDQSVLAMRIGVELGIKLAPPVVLSGLLGLKIGDEILHRRAIQAVYTALRALSVSRKEGHLCEIGGGVGMAAYYAMILGGSRYTLVDLPTMCLFQYFYLRRALPNKTISIVLTPSHKSSDVNIIPASVFGHLPSEWRWDAIVNCDSFPEMGESVCSQYFEAFRGRSPLLLSINQEANCPLTHNVNGPRQPVVSQMLRRRRGYRSLYRTRSWLRHGFAEELYQIEA
jgi:hypothetical protein